MTKQFRIEQADDHYDWWRLREVLVTWFQVGGFERKQTIKWSHFRENRSSQSTIALECFIWVRQIV